MQMVSWGDYLIFFMFLKWIFWIFRKKFRVGVCVCVCVWGGGGGGEQLRQGRSGFRKHSIIIIIISLVTLVPQLNAKFPY